jgi:hypothetical protein
MGARPLVFPDCVGHRVGSSLRQEAAATALDHVVDAGSSALRGKRIVLSGFQFPDRFCRHN